MDSEEVLNIIFHALREVEDARIDDVTMDRGVDGQNQVVLTTIDSADEKQMWILDAESILATNPYGE